MKSAVESLEQITRVQVFQNALDANGALEWIILFDDVKYDTEDPLPLLSLYTETLSAQWSGIGDQSAVEATKMVVEISMVAEMVVQAIFLVEVVVNVGAEEVVKVGNKRVEEEVEAFMVEEVVVPALTVLVG
ncbi:Fibronectin type III domain containing hypothetical protein, partial [Phytophthora palmivora]